MLSYHSKQIGAVQIYGLSTDAKPTSTAVIEGAFFMEEDTGKFFNFEGTAWVEKINPTYLLGTSLIGYITGTALVNYLTGTALTNYLTGTALTNRLTGTALTNYLTATATVNYITSTAVTDALITTSDITTNNSSLTKHGFLSKLPGGSTAFLRADGTWITPAGGAGEANTASNVGTAGIGVFQEKVGVDLEFKQLYASANIYIVDNVGSSQVDFSVPIATTGTAGVVELATSGENAANVVVQGNDARLSDSRTPLSHGNEGHTSVYLTGTALTSYLTSTAITSFITGTALTNYLTGTALTSYLTSTAITNFITGTALTNYLTGTALTNRLTGTALTNYLTGTALTSYLTATAIVGYITGTAVTDGLLITSDITTNNVSTTKHGFTPKAPNNTTQFLRADATWATASWTYLTLTTNFPCFNSTATNVPGMGFVISANTRYEFEASLMVQATNAAVAPIPILAWATATTGTGVVSVEATNGTTLVMQVGTWGKSGSVMATNVLNTGVFPAAIWGLMDVGTNPSGSTRIQIATEVANTQVNILKGSFLKYRTY